MQRRWRRCGASGLMAGLWGQKVIALLEFDPVKRRYVDRRSPRVTLAVACLTASNHHRRIPEQVEAIIAVLDAPDRGGVVLYLGEHTSTKVRSRRRPWRWHG